MPRLLPGLLWLQVLLAAAAQQCLACDTGACPRIHSYTIVAEYPHDRQAFTQGLQYERECSTEQACRDVFWESTGLYGESTMRKVDAVTGQVLLSMPLGQQWFAEGAAKIGNTLYQLTWQTGTIFKYRINTDGTLTQLGAVSGPLQDGWGLATDGRVLFATDSSATVAVIDPDTLQVLRTFTATDGGQSVRWLNELEMVHGELWANVWQTECIARINVTTGTVTHWMVLSGLGQGVRQRHPDHHEMDVLNGIAYDHANRRLFVTGKKWPLVFEVQPRASGPEPQLTIAQVRAMCIR